MNSPDEITEVKPRAHRGDDLDSRSIVRIAVIFVFTIAFCLMMMALLFRHFENIYPNRTSEAAPRVSEADLPPQPRLQTAPALDLAQVRAAEDQHLSRYAWIDRQKGLAQIPIDRAMELWVQTYGGAAATHAAPAAASISTNAAPIGTTELQMRQDKAKEAAHAP
jgi:hypothetical protein